MKFIFYPDSKMEVYLNEEYYGEATYTNNKGLLTCSGSYDEYYYYDGQSIYYTTVFEEVAALPVVETTASDN